MVLEANVKVVNDAIVVLQDESNCRTVDDVCLTDDDECLDDDHTVLDADVIFLEQHDSFLYEKIIVLSNHVERRRRKDGYPKDEDE